MLTRIIVLFAAALGLAACQTAPVPPPKYPQLTWQHLAPFNLKVARVEVVTEYQPPLKAPNVDHLFPVPPAKAMEQWAHDRLHARGGTSIARVIIANAGVVETELKKDKGIKGVFTAEQAERYDGRLNVTVEIRSDRGYREAFVHATARRTRSVPEDITLNGREKVWFQMTEEMMNDINSQLSEAIPQYFQRWLN